MDEHIDNFQPTVLKDDRPDAVSSSSLSSGRALVEWYRSLFSALSTLGTLGAGFTFSVVVEGSARANRAGFTPATVTTCAAISSVLFVLTVLVCQGCSQVFKFEQAIIAEGIDDDDACIKWLLAGLSLLLQCQILGAFLCLELVIAAHVPAVGWVGVGITSFLTMIALGLWGLQSTGKRSIAQYRHFFFDLRRKKNESLDELV